MTSLLMTSQIRFEVLRRAGNYIGSTHIGQSICNTSEIVNRKTQLQLENIYRGGVTNKRFSAFNSSCCALSKQVQKIEFENF